MKRISCKREILPFGNGSFYFGRSEVLTERLISLYKGSVSAIYLDPPFLTGNNFTADLEQSKVSAYNDNLDERQYMKMLKKILTNSRQLLSKKGTLYLHIDYRMSAKLRLLLDEVFGEDNFLNEIIWSYKTGGRSKRYYPRKHDTIFLYKNGRSPYFDLEAVGTHRGSERRNHMKYNVDESGQVYYSITTNGKTYKYYETDMIYPTDVWSDIEHLHQKDTERVGYPTQKPIALLNRVILPSSRENDIVGDFFSGSGTTAIAAIRAGRRWVCCDSSPLAAFMLRKRIISNHQELGFFASSGEPAYIECPKRTNDLTPPECGIIHSSSQSVLKLKSDYSVDQLSVGYVINGDFYAVASSVNCGKHTTLSFDETLMKGNPVIHVITTDGRHAFFAV